jgi:hypothetical protein
MPNHSVRNCHRATRRAEEGLPVLTKTAATAPHARPLAVLLLLLPATGWSATYTVNRLSDSGYRSLRWAIERANAHAGADTIAFEPALAGGTIRPKSALPTLTDFYTTIDGDIDGDGDPDICLNGSAVGPTGGLHVNAGYCTIRGLSIVRFAFDGIYLQNADHCVIGSCHLGADLTGALARPNGHDQIVLVESHYNTIGGPTPSDRNIIEAGAMANQAGVCIIDGIGNHVCNNNIGLARNGVTSFPGAETGTCGVKLVRATVLSLGFTRDVPSRPPGYYCEENIIGGNSLAERNVIGGAEVGVQLDDADINTIQGNYIGLGRDGSTTSWIPGRGLELKGGASNNQIGGPSAPARNVISGCADAVRLTDAGTDGNKIQGNYFGFNAAGTAQRKLYNGIAIANGAGAQTIGGSNAAAGNYFAFRGSCGGNSVYLSQTGTGTLVRYNKFGLRPDGKAATGVYCAVGTWDAGVRFYDNVVQRSQYGVRATTSITGLPTSWVMRNTFRRCSVAAVERSGDIPVILGNLQNASTADDGGNVFYPGNVMYIVNHSSLRLRAEGNDFRSTHKSDIEPKLDDKLDNGSYGRVDYIPLIGGVIPTGIQLALTGLAAVPTHAGAQVTFALSCPAEVSARVLNLAGRPIRALCQSRACDAGTNTLLWDARTDAGLSAPSGAYLLEITARTDDGAQTRALTSTRLTR